MPRRYNDAIYKDTVGALLQQSPAGVAGNGRRHKGSGAAQKNYGLDNRANIKEIQAQNRQRREAEAAPAAEPFKLRQFKNVKSRFASAAAAAAAATTPSPSTPQDARPPGSGGPTAASRDYLRKGAREKVATELREEALRRRQGGGIGGDTPAVTATGSRLFGSSGAAAGGRPPPPPLPPPPASSPPAFSPSGIGTAASGGSGSGGREHFSRDETPACRRGGGGIGATGYSMDHCGGRGGTPRKEAVPRAGDVARLAPRTGRDFVAANRMQAAEMKAKGVSDRDTTFTHESYGRVPDYLVSRQEEWEREEARRKAEAPDPSCPPGMKLMPEEDRLLTLKQLQENESSCQAQLNKFPLVVQTPLLQRRVDDLNKKLKEIDAAKAIFSRSRVYIARDS
eukprot:g7090.t1